MANVTYLLGAGASANALPVIKDMQERIQGMISLFEKYQNNINVGIQKIRYENIDLFKIWLKELISNLKWLHSESARHSTIDTFAKKLFITKKDREIHKLKITLSIFLSFEEQKNGYDKRYDTLFASIINKDGILPSNIKILSWNYDRQFEKAYFEYVNNIHSEYFDEVRRKLNFITPYNYNKCYQEPFLQNNNFEIIKLNGSIINLQYSSTPNHDPSELDFGVTKIISDDDLESFCLEYKTADTDGSRKYPSLRFAWEDPYYWDEKDRIKSFIETASERMGTTDVLVIIGYSFPFFNREIDKSVLGGMNLSRLQKVYIQDLFPNDMKTKFLATIPDVDPEKVVPMQIKADEPSEEFYMPPELTLA